VFTPQNLKWFEVSGSDHMTTDDVTDLFDMFMTSHFDHRHEKNVGCEDVTILLTPRSVKTVTLHKKEFMTSPKEMRV